MSVQSPECWNCGYEITGLRVEDNCPECGEPVWQDVEARAEELGKRYARADTSFWAALASLPFSVACGPFGVLFAIWAFVLCIQAIGDRSKGRRRQAARNMPIVSLVVASVSVSIALFMSMAWITQLF